MAAIPREFLGYNRAEVRRRLKAYEAQIADMSQALQSSNETIARLEAELEEQKIINAALRRRVQGEGSGPSLEPLDILIGPSTVLADMAQLIDDLESLSHMIPKFRIYRDGFYRISALTDNPLAVVHWLESRTDVAEVVVQEDAVHVVPKGRVAV